MPRRVNVFRFPPTGPYDSGVQINNGAGYAAATGGAMTVDDDYAAGDATSIIDVGDVLWVKQTRAGKGEKFVRLGIVTAVGGTAVTIGAGTTVAVVDNETLYAEDVGGPLYGKMLNTSGGVPLGPGAQFSFEMTVVRGEIVYTVTQLF